MNIHRILILAAAVVIAAAATAFAADGSQKTTRARTLSLVAVEAQCGGADFPPNDGSPGDFTMCRARIVHGGTAAWHCSYSGTEGFGDVCTAVAQLRRGDVVLAGRLGHTTPKSTWAVTGGTGAYAGARGTATVRQLNDTKTSVKIRLF
jgi:hypothetical protein